VTFKNRSALNKFFTGYNVINKIQQDNFTNPITGLKNNFFENVICVTLPVNTSPVDFNLSQEIKDLLMKAGFDAANNFFNSESH